MASFALILFSVTSPLDFVEPWQEVQWVSINGLMTDSNVLISASAIFASGFFRQTARSKCLCAKSQCRHERQARDQCDKQSFINQTESPSSALVHGSKHGCHIKWLQSNLWWCVVILDWFCQDEWKLNPLFLRKSLHPIRRKLQSKSHSNPF